MRLMNLCAIDYIWNEKILKATEYDLKKWPFFLLLIVRKEPKFSSELFNGKRKQRERESKRERTMAIYRIISIHKI